MKSKFAPLVKLKHSKMQEIERELFVANQRLQKAKEEYNRSKEELNRLHNPTSGNMKEFLATRSLIDSQLKLIEKNKNWIQYEEKQINAIKETLKTAMIEYEKFKYLQAKEIEKIKKAKKIAEAKRLDEVAIMTFKQKEEK